jgi:SAM-dependent methyltransferase
VYDPGKYGRDWADDYDEEFPTAHPAVIETIATLAGDGGRVLELGIGTGRIALPLVERDIDVVGIDASEEMVAKLRAKPGGADIPVTIGDFSRERVDGSFRAVVLAFNTLFALLEQDAQIGCFANAARHLEPGGVFALDAFVPDLGRYRGGQSVTTTGVDDTVVKLDASVHDAVRQLVRSRHVHISEAGVRLLPVTVRYAWPTEMDLMARLAGLRLRDRWEWWDRTPFTASSGHHVSVYEKPPAAS